jgi:hypothetical protein
MDLKSWAGSVNLQTPAGDILRRLAAALPQDRTYDITLFGSAPLQITIDAALLSADVDLFADIDELKELVIRAGLGEGQTELFIQVSSELNFRSSPRWRTRTQAVSLGSCLFHFPHPIDILIAKLQRLEEKDLLAFRIVMARTGHPTETELLHELQLAVDLFRPSFDEEQGHDLANNCRRLWPLIFGREIDPRAEIISPALKKRAEGYGEQGPDFKQELRETAAAYQLKTRSKRN